MFFRRVFSRKSSSSVDSDHRTPNQNHNNADASDITVPISPHRLQRKQIKLNEGFSVLQLTPLWEHIIRTKSLPSNINETEMFVEFMERLYDPEWQVRQHALKVLVDVLIVMSQRADQYFSPLIKPLVENLGHAAPAVQKGALDCLKVYMSETAMPETVLLEIIGIGMEQKLMNSAAFGRQCIAVMLSLPSLIQTQLLNKSKRSFVIKAAIDALTAKMAQVTYQETALKVLLSWNLIWGRDFSRTLSLNILLESFRIRQMIGSRDFAEHIAHGDHREFELLCNVYGLPDYLPTRDSRNDLYDASDSMKYSAWQVLSPDFITNSNVRPAEICWKSTTEDEADESDMSADPVAKSMYLRKADSCPNVFPSSETSEKVIMETEINIENTPITMRILEEKSYDGDNDACRTTVYEHSGIIRVLTDSELDEMNNGEYYTRGRTPRRVTFGGESIKLRTPDSDSVAQSDSDAKSRNRSLESSTVSVADILHIDIPMDNTKELSSQRSNSAGITRNDSTPPNSVSPMERAKSARQRRFSPANNSIVSPIPPHKQIEVLHNLQRSPLISPERNRRNSSAGDEKVSADSKNSNEMGERVSQQVASQQESDRTNRHVQKTSWEDLGLIDADGMTNLKSGDWRLRSSAVCQIEDALKSTENLALIQPYLDSLLRTLLSADDKHVVEDKCRVLVNLISRLPLDNLEDRTDQIIVGLCRQGGAGSNHIAKSLLQRLPPTVVVHKLLSEEFLNTRSARFRENALQIVLFALMTFPSTCFDIPMCVGRAVQAAVDRKRRVRQAALDVLAVLGQISSPKNVLDIVHQNMANREDGERLLGAVKARLARKQLPIISPNGSVQYALRIPSPDANTVTYLFGADIEWINAGVGYVSPLALKRHSTRLQRPQKYVGYDKNGVVEDITKQQRHKAPHEILAVGVGVKPPYDYNSNVIGNIGGYTKLTTADDDKNTHFVIATSVPSNSIPINFNGANKVKFQAKPFPEQLHATLSDNRDSMREYLDSYNGNKPSKLPVTSRFPAMENHYEARQGKATIKNHSYSNGYALRNGSNRYVYTNSSSQESPSDQSSTDEYRSHTYSTSSPPNRQRFANVNKYLSKKPNEMPTKLLFHRHLLYYIDEKEMKVSPEAGNFVSSHIKTEEAAFTRVQQISTVSSPSIDRTSSTVLLSSAEDADDRIVYEYASVGDLNSNGNRFSAHSKSSSKRSTDENKSNKSVHSNSPSKKSVNENVLDTSSQVTVVAVDEKLENVLSVSRPISVSSIATTKSLYDEYEERPATGMAKSNASSATTTLRESRSRTSFLAEEVDRPISVTPRPTSQVGETQHENDQSSDDEKSVEEGNGEIHVENEVKDEERNVEHLQWAGADEQDEAADTQDNAEVTAINAEVPAINAEVPAINAEVPAIDAQTVSSDSESNFTAEAEVVDEVDFVKERSDEQTTTSTVSSVQHFSGRQPVRFRKRKVSPTKQPVPVSSRPKVKDHVSCLQQLDSTNWDQIMLGLQSFVCLMRNNPEQIEPQLHQYCLALSKNIKNLRSQVSRASCQAAGEFFESHSKLLEQESDELALALLNRTADTNKFLRSDATKALKIMCEMLPVPKVIQIVTTKGATHQNAVVRTASANLCNQIIERCGVDKIFSMNRDLRDKLLLTGANLLLEGSLDTRNHAKMFFKQLSHHPSYHKTLLDVIPPRIYRNIEKTLKNI